MSKAGGIAYGVAAVLVFLLAAQPAWNALLWLHSFSSSTGMFALGLAAVAFASFGPFALSLCCWRLARSVPAAWSVHLLFVPCAYAMVYAGASVLNLADGRPGTDEPAGYAMMPAFLLLGLAILVHSAAFAFAVVAAFRRRANIG
ncbi:MAG TPA: hypothetical protein VGB48_06360 [Allosphingosinicella sp.]|jgi:hypothetical protein